MNVLASAAAAAALPSRCARAHRALNAAAASARVVRFACAEDGRPAWGLVRGGDLQLRNGVGEVMEIVSEEAALLAMASAEERMLLERDANGNIVGGIDGYGKDRAAPDINTPLADFNSELARLQVDACPCAHSCGAPIPVVRPFLCLLARAPLQEALELPNMAGVSGE